MSTATTYHDCKAARPDVRLIFVCVMGIPDYWPLCERCEAERKRRDGYREYKGRIRRPQ